MITINPFAKQGNDLEDTIRICRWLEADEVDAFHISVGSLFPHPLNPPSPLGEAGFPLEFAARSYGAMLPSGKDTFRNYLLFRYPLLRPIFHFIWNRLKKKYPRGRGHQRQLWACRQEGSQGPGAVHGGIPECRAHSRQARAGVFRWRHHRPGAYRQPRSAQGMGHRPNLPERPCTHCNKCLVYAPSYPLGCYELARYGGDYDRMIREVYEVFDPPF